MAAGTYVKVSGTWQPLAQGYVKVSGTWQPMKEIWKKVSGTWQLVWSAMTVVLPGNGGGGLHGTTCTSGSMTPIITGGTAPYTYSWAYVSGSVVTAATPTGASTTWSWVPGAAGSFSSVVKVTVTDNNGVVVVSNNATISWSIS